jgi:hypothetical protein
LWWWWWCPNGFFLGFLKCWSLLVSRHYAQKVQLFLQEMRWPNCCTVMDLFLRYTLQNSTGDSKTEDLYWIGTLEVFMDKWTRWSINFET